MAPHGAYRSGNHTLIVHWKNGVRRFQDQPPYAAELDGVHWSYCAFDATVKMHLIGKQDVDVFTGAMLDDSTGVVLAAGQEVVFSHSAKYYIAYEQPDGQDGLTIKLYNRSGKLLWKSLSGLLSEDSNTIIADFDRVRWTTADELMAEYESNGKPHQLFLRRDAEGSWHWRE